MTGIGWFNLLDRWTERALSVLQWLALPLVALLFLQWPLRDLVRAYSVQANDAAQIIFALYVAASVTAATRAGTHLAADALAQRYSARTRRGLKKAIAIALMPWALFVLIAACSTNNTASTKRMNATARRMPLTGGPSRRRGGARRSRRPRRRA